MEIPASAEVSETGGEMFSTEFLYKSNWTHTMVPFYTPPQQHGRLEPTVPLYASHVREPPYLQAPSL